MKQIILCEPNISEGTDLALVEQVADAIRDIAGVKLMDYSSDEDHNRSVFTFVGEPEAVLEAAKAMASKAIELIDMSTHKGSHPRMGAVDVAAFVPIRGIKIKETIPYAKAFGSYIGELGVPVYYYEKAATCPERETVPKIRKGEYEALAEKMTQEEWKPDEGPFEFNAKSGATITGVRIPLIAFNVNLRTTDKSVADKIAKSVRHISGGFRHVRAIGLTLEESSMVQVSMNLVDYRKSPIFRVLETIRSEAAAHGVTIAGTEIVGPVPLAAMEAVFVHYLQAHDFSAEQVVESALLD